MTISFEDLETAISQVESIRNEELTFQVQDTRITIRGLTPEEDTSVQRYAQEALNEAAEGDQAAFSEFMDRLRYGILGFAIMEIGALNLRGMEYVSVGTDDEGNSVEQPKNEALESLLRSKWSRPMLASVFKKFTELLDRIEMRADKSVQFEPADLDDEIKRVQTRLTELKAAKEKRQEDVTDAITRSQHLVGEVNSRQIDARRARQKPEQGATSEGEPSEVPLEAPQQAQQAQQAPQQSHEQAAPDPKQQQERTRYVPPNVAPPRRRAPEEDPLAQPPQTAPQPQYEESEEPQMPPHGIPDPHEGHSFMDLSDPDKAIYEEGIRQEALYRKQQEAKARQKENERQQREQATKAAMARAAQQRQSAAPPGKATDVSQLGGRASRDPGLRQALNTQAAVTQPSQPQIHSSSSQRPAQVNGMDVYRQPAQTLDRRAKQVIEEEAPPPAIVDAPAQGSQNPRFRGATRGDGGWGGGNFE